MLKIGMLTARRFLALCVIGIGWWAGASALLPSPVSAHGQNTILILTSDHYGHRWTTDRLAAINRVVAGRVDLTVEYLNLTARIGDKSRNEVLRTLLRNKYADRIPDVVITLDDEALEFYGQREALFSDVPVIASGVGVQGVALRLGTLSTVKVEEPIDVKNTLAAVAALHPHMKRLVVLNGGGLPTTRESVAAEVHRQMMGNLPAGVEVTFWDKKAAGDTIDGFPRLAEGDAALLATHPADPVDVGQLLSIPVPVYTVWDAYGQDDAYAGEKGVIVGGCMRQGADIGKLVGQQAMHALAVTGRGERLSAPTFYTVDGAAASVCVFDYPRLRRFGVEVDRLPAGIAVVNRPQDRLLPAYGAFPEFYWVVGLALLGVVTVTAGLAMRLSAQDMVSRKAEALAHHRAEELLAFREALDETYDAVLMFDERTLNFSYANRGALEQLGYTAAELALMTPGDIDADFDKQAITVLIETLRRGERSMQRYRTRHRRKDGRLVPVEAQIQFIPGREERPGRFIHIVRDISEILAAEAALRSSEERFELALAASTGGVWDWDLRTNTMWFSSRWKEQLGYRDDEIEHSFATWKRLIHPDDLAPAIKGFNDYNEGHQATFDMVLRFQHKDGHTVFIRSRAVHQKDDKGQVIRLVGAHSDVTERTLVEARLNESERRLWDLAIAVPGMMFQWIERFDGSHGFTWVSQRAKDIFGVEAAALVDDWTRMRIHPDDLDLWRVSLETAAMTGVDWELEGRSLHGDGLVRWWKVLARPVAGPDGMVFNGIFLDVTSERLMREETDRLRNRLDFLLNASPAIICAMAASLQGRTSFLTAGIGQFGYQPHLLLAEREWWMPRIHLDDRPAVQEGILSLLQHGRPVELSYRFCTADGAWRWVVDHRVLIADSAGNPLEIVGTMTDVTEVVEAEQRARQSQERLELVLQSAGEGIYGVDRDGHALFANAATQRMTGFTFAEMQVGQPHALFHAKRPDGSAYPMAECPILMTTRDGITRSISGDHFWHKDGTSFPVEFVASPLLHDGNVKGAVVVFRDVTEAVRIQGDLRRSMSRLEAILANSPVAITIVSLDGRFLMVNEQLVNMLGIPKEALIGQSTRSAYPDEETYDALRVAAYPMMMAGQVYRGEMNSRRPDGQRLWVHMTGTVIDLGDEEQGFVWVLEDITERRAQQTALQEKTKELERSNAELEAFAYVASHDLRQPLRAVTSYLKLLERQLAGKLDEDGRDFLNFALTGALRMDRLIVDLLDYSRVGRRSKPSALHSIKEIIQGALLNLEFYISDNGGRVSVGDDMPQIYGDDSELVRLFQNLIGNGIKYHAPDRPPEVHVTAVAVTGGWEFAVTDNGIGIPSNQLERIFGIFQRLHSGEAYEGSGIGLAICRKIVERHGGRIWAESTPGQGSVFRFTLPVLEQQPPVTA